MKLYSPLLRHGLPAVLLAPLLLAACDTQPACDTRSETVVDADAHQLLSSSLNELLAEYFPFSAKVSWSDEAAADFAGRETELTLDAVAQKKPNAVEVHQVAGPGFYGNDFSQCADHVRADVVISAVTDDGGLNESTALNLTIYENKRALFFGAEFIPFQGSYPIETATGMVAEVIGKEGSLDIDLSLLAESRGERRVQGDVLIHAGNLR